MARPLGSQDRTRLRQRLEQRYRELWDEAGGRADPGQYRRVSAEVPDRGDAALADLIVDLNLADVTRDIAEMRRISWALERIAEGRYGICAQCGTPIDAARLDANPTAARCIRCETEFERMHARQTGPRF